LEEREWMRERQWRRKTAGGERELNRLAFKESDKNPPLSLIYVRAKGWRRVFGQLTQNYKRLIFVPFNPPKIIPE